VASNGRKAIRLDTHHGENVLGNVNEESIYDIWHGEKLENIRKIHKQNNINKIIRRLEKKHTKNIIKKIKKG
jgi:hypothetical protein